VIDYLTFHSDSVAAAIAFFSRVVKSELGALGLTRICGAFYGYYFWDAGWPGGYHNSGHHALARVAACPDVDFIAAPHDYQECSPGGLFHPQLAPGTLRLNGKLFYSEEDTGTHKLKAGVDYCGPCPDLRTSLGVLRRDAAGVLMHAGAEWFADLYGGCFEDPDILRGIGELKRLFEENLAGDRRPASQLLVVTNEENARYLWYDGALSDALVPRTLSELTAVGAPFQTIDISDLDKFFAGAGGEDCRLVFFLDCVYLSAAHRRAIRAHAARSGRTLFWNYAAGLITEQGFSLAAMAEVTGIKVAWWDRNWPLKVFTFLTGDRITYGTDEYCGPWLYGDDPEAAVLGRLRGKTDRPALVRAPGLLEKDLGTWRSVWSAAPAIQAPVLREIARRAGVHIYSEAGDQVLATRTLLAVHAATTGRRRIRLPAPSDVTDALTGKPIGRGIREFKAPLEWGVTALWRLQPAGK
jgi:hypothetical protein